MRAEATMCPPAPISVAMVEMQRRLAAGGGHRADAALERRDALLQHRHGRVGDARVDVPGALQVEQRGRVLGVVEHVGRGLVDRHRARARRRVGPLPGVQARACRSAAPVVWSLNGIPVLGLPSPLWGGVGGGGSPDVECSAIPPSPSLPHKGGGMRNSVWAHAIAPWITHRTRSRRRRTAAATSRRRRAGPA